MLSVKEEQTPRKELANKLDALSTADDSAADMKLQKKLELVATKDEPILTPNPKRFVLFPIKYHEVYIYDLLLCL